jgi:hypothetical protein
LAFGRGAEWLGLVGRPPKRSSSFSRSPFFFWSCGAAAVGGAYVWRAPDALRWVLVDKKPNLWAG